MGVQVKPNWGRSYPVQLTEGPPVELVRLQLPRPTDVTVYLGEPIVTTGSGYPVQVPYTISFGSGGTARTLTALAPVLGGVHHVVASKVEVRSVPFSSLAVPPEKLSQVRISAMAGLGRPTEHVRRLFRTVNYNTQVTPGGQRSWVLDPFTTKVRITMSATAGAVADPALVTVTQILSTFLGETEYFVPEPLAAYATPKSVHPLANTIRVFNNAVPAIYIDIEQTILM